MFNAWLEISKCRDAASSVDLDAAIVRKIPALSNAFIAAQNAGSSRMWDYAQKLTQDDLELVWNSVTFAKKTEDARSIIHSIDVTYAGSCYTLRLFIEKSQ